MKSSVAFLSLWNLSFLGFSPVCWGWAGPSDTTVSPAALLGSTLRTLLPIMCSLCCTERYGAGRNPNQHRRPRARQDIRSIRMHTFTHKNTQAPFILSHTCNQLRRYWLQTHELVWLHKQRCVFWWWPRIHTRLGAAEALAVSFHPSAHRQPASVGAGERSTYQIHPADLQLLV